MKKVNSYCYKHAFNIRFIRCGVISFVLALCFFFSHPLVAEASSVESMNIDVSLQEDGSAVITQHWKSAYASKGSEYYLYYKDSGYLSFSDLKVSDNSQEYENIGKWDIDADFDEKAYRCGIYELYDGVELCWGISKYGVNDFTISYTIENLASAYEDSNGIFYRFINSLDFFPTDAVVTIHMADGALLTNSNASIWAFGYEGDIFFMNDGTIRASTTSPLYGDENMTLLIKLDSSLLSPNHTVENTMADVIDHALEDSDYLDNTSYSGVNNSKKDNNNSSNQRNIFRNSSMIIDIVYPVLGVLGLAIIMVIFYIAYKKYEAKETAKFNEYYASCDYFTDIPNEGNLEASYVLAHKFNYCDAGAVISIYLMKMMISGAIQLIDNEDPSKTQDFILFPEKTDGNVHEQELMKLLLRAAKGDNRLTYDQLLNFTDKYFGFFNRFVYNCEEEGQNFLRDNHCLVGEKLYLFENLTENGRAQLAQLIGSRKYLTDMPKNLSDDTQEPEISSDLLMYVVLFGLIQQFKIYYNKHMNDFLIYRFYYDYGDTICHYGHVIYQHVSEQLSMATGSGVDIDFFSGSGGRASIGGGSGFSGGGGGGTR